MAKDHLRLTVHQTAPLLGEVEANEEEFRTRVRSSSEDDLVVFPELSLTGYNLRSRVSRIAWPTSDGAPLDLPADSPPVVFGLPERGDDELVYNTALIVHRNRILARHRKVYLPTYGPFDEGRYYAPGKEAPPVAILPSGWRVGLLVCEDLWHPGLLYLLATQGAEVVVVLAAAPGRGEPPRDTESPKRTPHLFASTETWTLLARTAVLQYGIFLVIANRAGVEEGITFAGESSVVGPDGRLLAQGPQAEPATLKVSLSRGDLRRARTPYSHLRDEDPGYLLRALEGITGRK